MPKLTPTAVVKRPKAKPAEVVGLRHIAEDLNISVSLVSKVLSGRLGTSGANSELISAIHDKARQLNYRKNHLAEALRTGRQSVIGVCLHRHGGEGTSIVEDTVEGIAEATSQLHQRLMIHYYHSVEEFRNFSPDVHRSAMDGLIVAGIPHVELLDDLKAIHARGVPIVTLHDKQLDPGFANVGLDQTEVSRRATRHLIDDGGCRQLAHFRVPADRHSTLATDRYLGYCKALAERGLPYRPEMVIDCPNYSHVSGVAALNTLLERGLTFDGIVCQSDEQAVAAINVLLSRGRRVPKDVKLVGIDNAPFCKFAPVPLTSVSQEFRVRGRQSVQLLMSLLSGQEVTSVQIDPVLHIRSSSTEV